MTKKNPHMCTYVYIWPSTSADSTSVCSTNCKFKIFGKKCYIVADMYYTVRPIYSI